MNYLPSSPTWATATPLEVVLGLLPLDGFLDTPTAAAEAPDMYTTFDRRLAEAEGRSIAIELIDRFDFYR